MPRGFSTAQPLTRLQPVFDAVSVCHFLTTDLFYSQKDSSSPHPSLSLCVLPLKTFSDTLRHLVWLAQTLRNPAWQKHSRFIDDIKYEKQTRLSLLKLNAVTTLQYGLDLLQVSWDNLINPFLLILHRWLYYAIWEQSQIFHMDLLILAELVSGSKNLSDGINSKLPSSSFHLVFFKALLSDVCIKPSNSFYLFLCVLF